MKRFELPDDCFCGWSFFFCCLYRTPSFVEVWYLVLWEDFLTFDIFIV